MEQAVHNVRDILEREAAVYEELLRVAEEQREALIERRVTALVEIADRQARLLAHVSRIEREGDLALRRLSLMLDSGEVDPTVASVAARLSPSQAAPLLDVRRRLQEAAARLCDANRLNARLLESAMDLVRFTIGLLAGGAAEASPYPTSLPPRAGAARLVDQRV